MKTIIFFSFTSLVFAQNPCKPRWFESDSVVCVCNANYCDTLPKVSPIETGQFIAWTSDQDGLRFNSIIGSFSNNSNSSSWSDNLINIDRTTTYQKIHGFGGAFTDSTGINIKTLPESVQQYLINSYFSSDGIEYNLGRIPIGATDFSTHGYSYDDGDEDPDLVNFALAPEDYHYKIPIIQQALNLTNDLHLFGSAWTAPKWMKTNGEYAGVFGFVKPQFYQTWASYHLKFVEAYDQSGIRIWGLTTGNEPSDSISIVNSLPDVTWFDKDQNQWIINNLGPTIRNSNFSDLQLMAIDDNRNFLPDLAQKILQGEARDFVDGIAVHWYRDVVTSTLTLDETHFLYPDKFIIYTEACNGFLLTDVELGSWARAEQYANDIIENLSSWVVGWVDWNMALDMQGGPNYINNFVDSPIIVNAAAEEFYKNPTYYSLGHFSKFIPRNSARIKSSTISSNVPSIAFQRPDGGITLVVLNKQDVDIKVTISDPERGSAKLRLTEKSITSIVYW